MDAHATLGASNSHTWLHCAASPRLSEGIDDPGNEHALAGSQRHLTAEQHLRGESLTHPDLLADVQPYIDLIGELRAGAEFVGIEERVQYDEWVPGGFGTADAVIIKDGTLTVCDLKTGRNRVDAPNNSQLRLYGLACLQRWQFEYGIERIHMVICQPPLDHISEETISATELLTWGDWVKQRAMLTQDPDAPATPGPEQCRWCRARHTCRDRAVWALSVPGSTVLTPSDYADILPLLDGLGRWISDMEHQVQQMLELGKTVPGYKLVEGRRTRKLKSDAADTLRDAGLTDDQIYRRDYQTLTAIEKALGGKKAAAPILAQCTSQKPGNLTIAPETDPRPAVEPHVEENFPVGE